MNITVLKGRNRTFIQIIHENTTINYEIKSKEEAENIGFDLQVASDKLLEE